MFDTALLMFFGKVAPPVQPRARTSQEGMQQYQKYILLRSFECVENCFPAGRKCLFSYSTLPGNDICDLLMCWMFLIPRCKASKIELNNPKYPNLPVLAVIGALQASQLCMWSDLYRLRLCTKKRLASRATRLRQCVYSERVRWTWKLIPHVQHCGLHMYFCKVRDRTIRSTCNHEQSIIVEPKHERSKTFILCFLAGQEPSKGRVQRIRWRGLVCRWQQFEQRLQLLYLFDPMCTVAWCTHQMESNIYSHVIVDTGTVCVCDERITQSQALQQISRTVVDSVIAESAPKNACEAEPMVQPRSKTAGAEVEDAVEVHVVFVSCSWSFGGELKTKRCR